MRRAIRKLMAEAKAEAAKAKAEAKWSSAREPPWVLQDWAVGGQVRPSGAAAAPLRPRFLVQRDQEAPRSSPWALFRARRRRWARAAGHGAAREPPWAPEGWGRRRPDAPLWCG